jgi:1,4-dihydroxy-2-naphthoate polyprenyltransferase
MTTPFITTWLAAARPRTLSAALAPVLVGLAVAMREQPLHWPAAVATLLAALLIQIGTNLANDYYDFVNGADTADRLGPPRITQAGLAAPAAVRRVALAVLALAAAIGVYLVIIGGWPILTIGVLSLVCALAYTGGPWPLAAHGLGEVFVFLFFGVLAVNGTVWLQTGGLSTLALLASLPVACLATAILVINNLRDIPTDARAGKRTLAVRIGATATRGEYLLLVTAAFFCPLLLSRLAGPGVLLALAALPLALGEARALWRRTGAELNRSLAGTARLHLVFGVLLAIGIA